MVTEFDFTAAKIAQGSRHRRTFVDLVCQSQIGKIHVGHQITQPRAIAQTAGELVLKINILGGIVMHGIDIRCCCHTTITHRASAGIR